MPRDDASTDRRGSRPPGAPDGLLEGLDPEQLAAVTAPVGAIVVHAGAGSGKTTVLTRRIAHRLADGTADPEHTVAITFTRQAAAELRRRLHVLGVIERIDSPAVVAGTFHAIAWRLLQRHHVESDRTPPQVTMNPIGLVAEALGSRASAPAPRVLAAIDWARSRMLGPDDADEVLRARPDLRLDAAALATAMRGYEQIKRKRGVLDLNDMISRVVETAATDAAFLASIRWRHRHIHVDEAQDMNPLQFALLGHLVGSGDVFAVGDPNQAIYGWNGADRNLFEQLPERIGGATVLPLRSNYRCTPQVVGAAVHALSNSGQVADAVSRRLDGPAVRMLRAADEVAERDSIARHLIALSSQGLAWHQMAVLARTNRLADELALDLDGRGIPVRQNRASNEFLDAVAEVTALGSRHKMTIWAGDVLDLPAQQTSAPDRSAAASDGAAVEVARLVREFLTDTVGAVDGRSFSTWLATRTPERAGDGVDVMTVHVAKGREWAAVVVAGAEVGLLPHSSARTPEARAEEGRLAYVAFTRASDHLAVSWTDKRKGRRTGPSPLLRRLPLGTLETAPPPDNVRDEIRARGSGSVPDPVLIALRAWRASAAKASLVDERGVLSDTELVRLAEARPATENEVIEILGPVLGRRHSRRLIEVISTAS